MTPNERAVQPHDKPADTVSVEELRQRELQSLIEAQAAEIAGLHRSTSVEELLNAGDDVPDLLDPFIAYEQEAARYRTARPRRRMTAEDLP